MKGETPERPFIVYKLCVLFYGSGVGVTKPISSVPLFSEFLEMSKESLAIEYHVYIWQVSPQLSCGDICQI